MDAYSYSPGDPLRADWVVNSSDDSRPHSSLLDAFSGGPRSEGSRSPEGLASFGTNCPAVFVLPAGMPMRATKEDMGHTSGVESITRKTEEGEVLGHEDAASHVPSTFYSHKDLAIGTASSANQLTSDTNSQPSHSDMAVEEHFQLVRNYKGNEEEEKKGAGEGAHAVPLPDAEDGTDHSGNSHTCHEDLHAETPHSTIASAEERIASPPNSVLVPIPASPVPSGSQTLTEGRPVTQSVDAAQESLHAMLPTVELSHEHPLSPSESDNPYSPREVDYLGSLKEGGRPSSLSESNRPHSPRQVHDPHSLTQVDGPHTLSESDDGSRTLSESDHSHGRSEADHPYSLSGGGQDGTAGGLIHSSTHLTDARVGVMSEEIVEGGARMPTHLRPVRTLDKRDEERQFPRNPVRESPHLVPTCDDGGEEGPTATTPHSQSSATTEEADVPPPLSSGVEADKHLSTKASVLLSSDVITSVQGDRQLSPLSESMKDALHAAQMELEQAVLDRARLGGQLETVLAESQSVLTERAELQTKVAQLEAQLSLCTSGQAAESKKSNEIVSLKEKVASITAKYQSMHTALDRERRVTEELRSKLRLHKVTSPTHSVGVDHLQVARLNDKVAQLESELATLKEELTGKEEECSKASQKLTVQKSASESLERTNTWLRQQLDDTMTSKSKLQAELHDARAGSISQSIGLDQAKKEVALYQQQVSELQKALWKEKAEMVKSLEVIEADVLSKEGSYQALMQDKLELSGKCARMEVEAAAVREVMGETEARVVELETKLAESQEELQTVTGQLSQRETEKAALTASSASLKAELEKQNEEITKLKSQLSSLNGTLQGVDIRLRQKDVELASAASDKEIMERQRDAAMERQVLAEAELGRAREMLAELEGRLEVLSNSAQESEEGLQAVTANHRSLTLDVNQLRKALAEKDELLAQRTQQALSVEQQVSELLTQLHALQQQYGEIKAAEDLTQSAKNARDHAIEELEAEKESLREQLAQQEELFGKLEQEKARLEGEVDALTQQSALTGDISQLNKEKMHIQTELNAERVKSQHETLQLQTKIDSLETELNTSRKESSKLEKRLQQLSEKRSAEEMEREKQLQELREELSRVSQQAHDLAQENYAWQEASEKANSSLSFNESECEHLRDENRKALLALQRLDTQFKELQERGQREMELLRQKTEDEKRSLNSKVQQLSIEIERHRGRLAGMGHTQVTMKRHAEALEEALADRESAFAKLSQRVIDEKEVEDSHLFNRIGLLENELETRRLDVESLSSQLSGKDAEIELLAEELSRRGDKIYALQQAMEGLETTRGETSDRLEELERENDQVRMECSSLKSKLASQVSVVESYQLGVKEKGQQVDVLTKELHTFKLAAEEVQTEVEKLKEYHKVAEERRQAEVESLQRMLDETLAERNSLRERLLARTQGSASSPKYHISPLSSPSLSSIHSDTESAQKRKVQPEQEETDLFVVGSTHDDSRPSADLQARLEKVEAVNDSLRQSGQAAVGQVLVYHQLMRRQEEDMTKRLEEAWQHGQELAESKKSAEIAVLKDELGYKHKSLDALRSTLSSLRRDMSKLQGQMDKHSLAARASSHSSRELECRLEDLRRSSRIPSNHSSWQRTPDTSH